MSSSLSGLTRKVRGTAGRARAVSPAILYFVAAWLTNAPMSGAKTFYTLEEALREAFPDAEIRRDVLFPKPEELAQASDRAGVQIPETPIYRYRAFLDGALAGTAYLDRHRVRTLPEIVLVLVTPEGHVRDILLLAFSEPEEYIPSRRWYDRFRSKALDPELRLGRGIDAVTGATLTARATTQCVRRVLALHQLFETRDPS